MKDINIFVGFVFLFIVQLHLFIDSLTKGEVDLLMWYYRMDVQVMVQIHCKLACMCILLFTDPGVVAGGR